MDLNFDSPGLESLFADLVAAPAKLKTLVRAVVVSSADAVKTDARQRFEDQRVGNYLPRYSGSITYSIAEDPAAAEVTAEIGPDRSIAGMQGFAGPVMEFGTARTAPHPHLMPAADAEEPRFVVALEDAVGEVLL